MNSAPTNFYLLATAVFSLLVGLIIFIWISRRGYRGNFLAANLLCWLLIALFPVFMIFSFFPNSSEIKGTIFGYSMSGVIAAFIFIWWFGARKTIDAVSKDVLNNRIGALETQLAAAQIIHTPKPQKLPDGQIDSYDLSKVRNKKIALITGNLKEVKNIDIWVNSENTNMQMASYFDRSVSGTIRYYGAQKDNAGNVTQDTIGQELAKVVGGNIVVMPATVMVTGAGELASNNRVKKIFHVASVRGTPGVGYEPVADLGACITNALAKADSPELAELQLRSIIFPLLGTGQGRGDPKPTIKTLIESAIFYLESHPTSNIETVYFLALYDNHLAICQEILQTSPSIRH